MQRYGRGRAFVLATGGTWRWKMRLPHTDERFATFWRQLLRALAGSAPEPVSLAVAAEAVGERPGARVQLRVQSAAWQPVESPEVSLRVVPESGAASELELLPAGEPGLYEARFTPEPGQLYRLEGSARAGGAELGGQQRHFRHAPDRTEDFRPELNRGLLERIALASGGAVWGSGTPPARPRFPRRSRPRASVCAGARSWSCGRCPRPSCCCSR
jgi:hypothetical protein